MPIKLSVRINKNLAPQEIFYKEIPSAFFNDELKIEPKVVGKLFDRDPANIVKVKLNRIVVT